MKNHESKKLPDAKQKKNSQLKTVRVVLEFENVNTSEVTAEEIGSEIQTMIDNASSDEISHDGKVTETSVL